MLISVEHLIDFANLGLNYKSGGCPISVNECMQMVPTQETLTDSVDRPRRKTWRPISFATVNTLMMSWKRLKPSI